MINNNIFNIFSFLTFSFGYFLDLVFGAIFFKFGQNTGFLQGVAKRLLIFVSLSVTHFLELSCCFCALLTVKYKKVKKIMLQNYLKLHEMHTIYIFLYKNWENVWSGPHPQVGKFHFFFEAFPNKHH